MRWSVALLLPALALAAPVPKAKEASPPFPIMVGDTREYETRSGDKAAEAYSDVVTQADKQKDGSTHVSVRRSYPRGEPYTTVIAVSDTGLSRMAEGSNALAKPTLLLKLPATVGTRWEEGDTKYEVTAEEEVTVRAGRYKTARVAMKTGGGTTTLWFAPAVGLVKMASEGSESTLELKAFKPGK